MSALSQFPFASQALEGEQPTCSFHFLKRVFGQAGGGTLGERTPSDELFAGFLEGLIAHHKFPRPLPCPKWGGGVELGVTRKSHWLRAGVVEWFGDYLPPDAAAALDAAALQEAADDMDRAAGNLRLVAERGERV